MATLSYQFFTGKIPGGPGMDYLVSPTSSATITDDLLNLSPRSWNATLYYDDGTFSARVSGSKRSSYLQQVQDCTATR